MTKYRAQGRVVDAVKFEPGTPAPEGFRWREVQVTGGFHSRDCKGKAHAIVEDLAETLTACPGDYVLKSANGYYEVVSAAEFAAKYDEEKAE